MASYVELIVGGDDRELKAYLAGYMAASAPARVVYADEAGFHIRKLRERIRHHGEIQHVIVEEAQAPRVRAALAQAGPRYRFDIREERRVGQAHFELSFDTPSREVAAKLKAALSLLPPGIELLDYAPGESTDAEAAGAELYSPEHDFDFQGSGVIRGDVFAVVDLRASLSDIDFVDCEEIVLVGD